MRALQFVTDDVIFKLPYNQIYQMKTTYGFQKELFIIFENKRIPKFLCVLWEAKLHFHLVGKQFHRSFQIGPKMA